VNINQAIALLEQRRDRFGGELDLTTMEYAGGDDRPCDVIDFEFDEETGSLRIRTRFQPR
jgi:hypothetical protein